MMEPFFFGSESRRLFGAYHPPDQARTRSVGVVLCYPWGQEYIRSHRAFLRLAQALSRQGFSVLRFDYYGCGDSMGECREGAPAQWVADIAAGIEELEGAGAAQVALVGLRFGATLAMLCGCERGDIEAIVLWEPVISGNDHLHELHDVHHAWLASSFARPHPSHESSTDEEILGFPVTPSMRTQFERCDLLTLEKPPARRIHIVVGGFERGHERLADHLKRVGAEVSCRCVRSPRIWEKGGKAGDKGLVPVEVIEDIGTWMAEAFG